MEPFPTQVRLCIRDVFFANHLWEETMAHPNRTAYLLLLAVIAAVALTVSGCAPALVQAPEKPSARTITVVGQGTVSVKPDLALANLGVETVAATVAEAVQENNTRMAAILAKLKALNIPDKDIQTSGFSISSYDPGMPKATPGGAESSQYRVSNTVAVKVRQIEQLGTVLDGAIEAGVNQVYGVNFTVEDPHSLQGQAREKAVSDAEARAEALARLANVKVGQVLAMSESGAGVPAVFADAYAFAKGAGPSMPLSPGEVQVSYQVQVTYAIE
jgi:uncharacterized protein YggE